MINTFRFLNTSILPVLMVFSVFQTEALTQNLPLGYIEQYNQKCNSESFFKTFLPEIPQNWKIINDKGSKVLAISAIDSFNNNFLPGTRGIINNMILGDFIIEFEFRNKLNVKNNEGFCFLGPVKSHESYYSFTFSSDSVFFVFVNRGKNQLIDKQPSAKFTVEWIKIRIERNILMRNITILINGNKTKILTFNDKNLVMGYIGFGSTYTVNNLRNIKVWAPTTITDSTFVWH
jgi:hypothetical protein